MFRQIQYSILVLCFYTLYLFMGNVCAEESINKIIASVTGEPITYYDVLVAMYPKLQEAGIAPTDTNDIRLQRLRETALNELINTILIRQEAQKYNLRITEQELDSEMRKIARENNTSIDVLEQQIRMQGGTLDAFKKNLRNNLLQQRMIATFVFRKIVVTVQEVDKYYKEHIDTFRTDSKYSVRFIAIPNQNDAKREMQKIQSSSMPFASIQKAYASRYGSDNIGVLDNLIFSELSMEWQNAIVDAKEKDIIGPIHVDDTYFIVYIEKKEEGKALPFEDVYTTIEGKIRDAKFSSQYADFIQSLRAKADIKLYQ